MGKSVFKDDRKECCYLCGLWCKTDEHHIFESEACRKKSDRYGLVVHLCRKCHDYIHHHPNGHDELDRLHKMGQRYYEDHIGTREEFIEEFIRSYL